MMDVEILLTRPSYRINKKPSGIFALIRDTPGSPHPTEENRADRKSVPLESTGTIRKIKLDRNTKKGLSGSSGVPLTISGDENQDVEPDLESVYGELKGQIAKISISHDIGYATAVCLAAEEPMAGDVGGEAAARMP